MFLRPWVPSLGRQVDGAGQSPDGQGRSDPQAIHRLEGSPQIRNLPVGDSSGGFGIDLVVAPVRMLGTQVVPDHLAGVDEHPVGDRQSFGTGFRADVITLTHIKALNRKGTQLAKLLCTNNSTVSRILNDLRACQFLDHDNERMGHVESYPGMFISTQSLWNLCEMIDASKFSFEELKRGAFENLALKHDGFGKKVFLGLV